MHTRRRNPIQKGLKDYMVPLIGLFLILLLIISLFTGGDDTPTQIDLENKIGLELMLDGSNTESYIVYPWDYKKQIEGDISLYKWEKVIVKEGSVSLSLAWLGNFRLNKLWEMKYLENWDFSLYSSDMWLDSTSGMTVEMRFASVKIGDNTHVSFSQNEMWSTIYLLNGFAEVTNLAWESTVLWNGQKITISRLNANKSDIDLSIEKENIGDFFKQSDWFLRNNGGSYLMMDIQDDGASTGSGKTFSSSSSQLLSFNNLSDGSNVSSDSINITWSFSDEEITKISVNGVDANINSDGKTFKIEKVSTSDKENDLVFKVYDDANDLLSKFVYVVYYDGGTSSASRWQFNVQTFDVDGSQFIFSSIKDGTTKALNGKTTYTTYGDMLTIYWNVSAQGIANVSVNGYTLKSFNGSSWRYHPSSINNNLSVGTNVYEVKYYDASWKVVYTNHFTIIKKELTQAAEKDTKTISDEASVN